MKHIVKKTIEGRRRGNESLPNSALIASNNHHAPIAKALSTTPPLPLGEGRGEGLPTGQKSSLPFAKRTSLLGNQLEGLGKPIVDHQSSIICNPQSDLIPQLLSFRPYQLEAFNSTAGLELWLWARQTGKSYTLAAWAIHRLLTRPGRLVTILSNSKTNGIELNKKIADICRKLAHSYEQLDLSPDTRFETFNTETRITLPPLPLGEGQGEGLPINEKCQMLDDRCSMNFTYPTQSSVLSPRNSPSLPGRIKILAANPRTARGFSGDLILDEFAFHENAHAIWEAAEPILAANPDFQCRIASTPNGKHNLFYQLATSGNIPIRKITRTQAHSQGCPIFHPITRDPIDPQTARNLAPNKRAYDQNYECAFEDQNMALLTHDLITAAERPNIGYICHQDWSDAALNFLCRNRREEILTSSARSTNPNPDHSYNQDTPENFPLSAHPMGGEGRGEEGPLSPLSPQSPALGTPYNQNFSLSAHPMGGEGRGEVGSTLAFSIQPLAFLYAGIDVARHHDQTVITILEKQGHLHIIRAILRMRDLRLPDQQQRLTQILSLPNLIHAKIDITGLGLGLFEFTQKQFPNKISGVNFSATVPSSSPQLQPLAFSLQPSSPRPSVRITEYLATQLLQTYEDHAIHQPVDNDLREDLRKPERLISPSGRVSIAATRDPQGHADHFWSLALAIDAAKNTPRPSIHSTPVEIRFTRTGAGPGRAPRRHHFPRR